MTASLQDLTRARLAHEDQLARIGNDLAMCTCLAVQQVLGDQRGTGRQLHARHEVLPELRWDAAEDGVGVNTNTRDRCPVCWREVPVSSVERWVWAHKDKAGGRCPMSGHPLPLSVWGNVA